MSDFRADYLEESRKSLLGANKILRKYPGTWSEYPEFWANILGAIANASIAATPDSVVTDWYLKQQRQKAKHDQISKMLDEKLGCG